VGSRITLDCPPLVAKPSCSVAKQSSQRAINLLLIHLNCFQMKLVACSSNATRAKSGSTVAVWESWTKKQAPTNIFVRSAERTCTKFAANQMSMFEIFLAFLPFFSFDFVFTHLRCITTAGAGSKPGADGEKCKYVKMNANCGRYGPRYLLKYLFPKEYDADNPDSQRSSTYLPVNPGSSPAPSSRASSRETSRRSKDPKSRNSEGASNPKRRSTMNSRDAAYDEEEQLRRAIQESKEDSHSLPDETSTTRRGKRSRSDSEACVFLAMVYVDRCNPVTDIEFPEIDKAPSVHEQAPHPPPLYRKKANRHLSPHPMMSPRQSRQRMVLEGKGQHPGVSVIRNPLKSPRSPRSPKWKLRKRSIIEKRGQPGAKVMVSINRFILASSSSLLTMYNHRI